MKAKKDMLKVKRRLMMSREWSTLGQHISYTEARLNRLGKESLSTTFLAFLYEVERFKAHRLLTTIVDSVIEDEL